MVAIRPLSKGENIMSNNNQKPSHYVYTVRDGKKDKAYWTKIGAAFAHGDGKGLSIILDAFPVDGQLTIREPEPKQ